MELTISKKEKNKAQRNRIHKEKKWRPFKMVYHFSFLIAICSLVYGVLIVTSTNYINFDKCAIVFASTFVVVEDIMFSFGFVLKSANSIFIILFKFSLLFSFVSVF